MTREKLALQKADYCYSMDTSFLRELAEGINLSFRFHGDKSKDALVRILRRKLDAKKLDVAFKMYMVCYEAKDVVQQIKPKGMSEIVETLQTFLEASEFLHEVTVESHRCDLVFFSDNSINAIEVKSSLDKMSRAGAQLDHYRKWANKVYLAFDTKHRPRVNRLHLAHQGIGLLEFEKGKIRVIQVASFQERHKVDLLSLMTYNYMRKIAVAFKAELKGDKRSIAKRLSEKMTQSQAKNIFKDFLRARALV